MGLTVLIILFGMGGLIYYVSKKSMNKKFTKFFFIGYVAILCLSLVIYELGLSKKLTLVEQRNIVSAEKEIEEFFDALYEGRLEDIDPNFIFRETEIDYPNDQLTIEMGHSEDGFGVSIVVERKTVNDDKIDVTYYRTKPNIQGIDDMKDVPPIEMAWTSERLTLTLPKGMEFNLSLFKKEFPISQFYGDEEPAQLDPTFMMSNEVIYLRVPKDLEISEGMELFIVYVGEEE